MEASPPKLLHHSRTAAEASLLLHHRRTDENPGTLSRNSAALLDKQGHIQFLHIIDILENFTQWQNGSCPVTTHQYMIISVPR